MKIIFQHYFPILGVAQGLFLFFLLITRRQNKPANKVLGLLIFLVSANYAIPYLYVEYDFFWYARMDMFVFFYGPLIFFHSLFLTGFRAKLHRLDYLHLTPALILLAILLLSFTETGGLLRPILGNNSPFASAFLRAFLIFSTSPNSVLVFISSIRLIHPDKTICHRKNVIKKGVYNLYYWR